MELKLSCEEVEVVLLEWAEHNWPNLFNEVRGDSYHSIPGVVFDKTEPVTPPEPQA